MASAQMPSIDYRSFLQLHHADGQSAQEIECDSALKAIRHQRGGVETNLQHMFKCLSTLTGK